MQALTIGGLTAPVPIIQGGMGVGLSLSGLAAAVAEQGGIGVIAAVGLGMVEPGSRKDLPAEHILGLRREIQRARAKTKGVLGVNIMVALSNYAELVKAAVQEKIDVIFSGAGLPLSLPALVPSDAHTRLVPIVSSARAAAIICRQWIKRYQRVPDAVVVEGPLAGGHLGFSLDQIDSPEYALEKLVPATIEALKPFEESNKCRIPVIAAGGIYTGADIYRFFQLGAAGVQLGTRFVTTHECDAGDGFKQAYLNAKQEDITIINSPVGMPGRAIRNAFIDSINRGERIPFGCPFKCIVSCDGKNSPYCIAIALLRARRGDFKHGFAFAGANAYRSDQIISVRELISTLIEEYEAAAAGDHGTAATPSNSAPE